jgi:hypothetical protein
MDSTAQTGPMASAITNETPFMGDAWIGQHKQALGPKKSSTKLLPWVTQGFDTQKALGPQKSPAKLLSRVMQGFDSANSP